MPAEGLEWKEREEILTFEEIERLTRIFARLGASKVRLTGGEPTVRKDIERLMASISNISGVRTLLMTTNGFRLAERAVPYRESGLNGLNISLDSLRPDRFRQITRTDNFAKVWHGVEAALEAGFDPVKINVVVMAGVNEDELVDFVELTRGLPLNVRFIEFMPFLGNGWTKGELYPYRRMREDIEARFRLEALESDPSAVAKDFRVPGFAGSVSFVTSMTESFCAGCNRIRLTADGCLKPCLFGPLEVSLRDPMREGASDDDLEAIIRATLLRKDWGHAPAELIRVEGNRPMISIGG
jgi:cyclic pyranopterin phosphate synthase